MSPTISRLLLAFSILIGIGLCYPLIVLGMDWAWGIRPAVGLLTADLICNAGFVGAWILLWRRVVHWTPWRIMLTAAIALGALAPAVISGALINQTLRGPIEPAIILGGMVYGVVFLGLTAIIWRETTAERSQRLRSLGVQTIACPSCGYNLTGLRGTTCPECGVQYTLDGLLASVLEERDKVEGL